MKAELEPMLAFIRSQSPSPIRDLVLATLPPFAEGFFEAVPDEIHNEDVDELIGLFSQATSYLFIYAFMSIAANAAPNLRNALWRRSLHQFFHDAELRYKHENSKPEGATTQ